MRTAYVSVYVKILLVLCLKQLLREPSRPAGSLWEMFLLLHPHRLLWLLVLNTSHLGSLPCHQSQPLPWFLFVLTDPQVPFSHQSLSFFWTAFHLGPWQLLLLPYAPLIQRPTLYF